MTDRDRLIELIADIQNDFEKWCVECAEDGHKDHQPLGEYLADKLLANGVIVPPMPIGSNVYEIRAKGNRPTLYGSRKVDFGIMSKLYFESAVAQGLEFYVKEKSFVKYDKTRWNKTVFLTKEEAEAKLKENEQNG